MGNRYGGDSDGSDGSSAYQDRRPDDADRADEQQTVYAAIADTIVEQYGRSETDGSEPGENTNAPTDESGAHSQSTERYTSEADGDRQRSSESGGASESASSSGNGSGGRTGSEHSASAAISTALRSLISDTPRQMTAAQHRATKRVVETAIDAGIDLGEAIDVEVHEWMLAIIDGETVVQEKTREEVGDLVDLFDF